MYTIDNCNDYLCLRSTVPVHKVFLRGDGAFQKAILNPFSQKSLLKAMTNG